MQIGEDVLRIKQKLLQLYRNYERWIMAVIKFVMIGLGITIINRSVGSIELLTSFYVIMGMAFIGMFMPIQWVVIGLMLIFTAHMMYLNSIIGLISLLGCIGTYVLVIRIAPKYSVLIILMMAFCSIGGSCILPMIVALFFGLESILSLLAGIVLFNVWGVLIGSLQSGILTTQLTEFLTYIMDSFIKNIFSNQEMFAMMIIMTIVYLTIYIIKKQSIEYAAYLAIGAGTIMNLLGFLLADLFLNIDVEIFNVIMWTTMSAITCVIAEYIIRPTDYSKTEVVQFEDEDNYYYVKVVPKITLITTKTHIEEIYTSEDNNIEAQ